MLKGFENITHDLTDYEATTLLPILTGKLCHHKGKSNAVTNGQLSQYVFDRTGKKVSGPRIRKIVEAIRQTHLLESLAACNNGYYIANTPGELKEWLDSMRQRRAAINSSIAAGLSSYKKMTA